MCEDINEFGFIHTGRYYTAAERKELTPGTGSAMEEARGAEWRAKDTRNSHWPLYEGQG